MLIGILNLKIFLIKLFRQFFFKKIIFLFFKIKSRDI
jgi:hypothetical protein